MEKHIERTTEQGVTNDRLKDHDEHFAEINGSIAKLAAAQEDTNAILKSALGQLMKGPAVPDDESDWGRRDWLLLVLILLLCAIVVMGLMLVIGR